MAGTLPNDRGFTMRGVLVQAGTTTVFAGNVSALSLVAVAIPVFALGLRSEWIRDDGVSMISLVRLSPLPVVRFAGGPNATRHCLSAQEQRQCASC